MHVYGHPKILAGTNRLQTNTKFSIKICAICICKIIIKCMIIYGNLYLDLIHFKIETFLCRQIWGMNWGRRGRQAWEQGRMRPMKYMEVYRLASVGGG